MSARIVVTPENLDCFASADALRAWADAGIGNGVRPITAARDLFPGRPKGYVHATRLLRAYAHNKATAMDCRLRGDISIAVQYEDICDRIYARLPEFARAW